MKQLRQIETQVIVIGGGATGTGTLRDLSLRGIPALLIEKIDFGYGTTGRNHGLLHSGARYAVKDIHSAKECIKENKILKKIARHCIEDTGGLFITLPSDDQEYHKRLKKGCRKSGIEYKNLSPKAALEMEPSLNPTLSKALLVPDGTIDPFRLASANVLDAKEHGASILTHTKVNKIIVENGNACGVLAYDEYNKEEIEIRAELIVNASGIWSGQIGEMAGIKLNMYPSKGALIIVDYRINMMVVNHCRTPASADIVVPGDTVSLIGTTSKRIDYSDIDKNEVDDKEVEELIIGGTKLIPALSKARIIRAYSGVRPLMATSGETVGRNISRGIVVLDHAEHHGIENFISVTGGKLMTYRLMAEMTVDLVCKKLKINKECETHKRALPGSKGKAETKKNYKDYSSISRSIVGSTMDRHGKRIHDILKKDPKNYALVCECEMVTQGEVGYALKTLEAKDIIDLRRRTRLGMGPCQGELCALRAAGSINEGGHRSAEESIVMLKEFMEERWKGERPILWGDALREAEFTHWIYYDLLGLGRLYQKDKQSKTDETKTHTETQKLKQKDMGEK